MSWKKWIHFLVSSNYAFLYPFDVNVLQETKNVAYAYNNQLENWRNTWGVIIKFESFLNMVFIYECIFIIFHHDVDDVMCRRRGFETLKLAYAYEYQTTQPIIVKFSAIFLCIAVLLFDIK